MKSKFQISNFKFLVLGIILLILLPGVAHAQATGFESICSAEKGLAVCVQQIYLFSLGAGSLLAFLMLVLAGYKYMTAGGNATRVEGAKEMFGDAFIGLIIIFVAYILLNLINPDLVRFRDPSKTLTLPAIPTGPAAPTDVQQPAPVPGTLADLATRILSNSRIALDTSNLDYPPHGPKENIENIRDGKLPAVCDVKPTCPPGGKNGNINIREEILSGILDLATQNYNFIVTSFTTGDHGNTSAHYAGRAVDLHPTSSDRRVWVRMRDAIRATRVGSVMCEHKRTLTDVADCNSNDVNHIHWEL